jgi:hypothetical protein
MARLYQLKVERGDITAILYYHDDGTLEIVDADSGEKLEYLQEKLFVGKRIFEWMKTFNVSSIEVTEA